MDAEDEEGETPMDVAVRYGYKKCERHLFMWQWQQRARRVGKRPESPPPWPHQKYDSNLPPLWLTAGTAAQVTLLNYTSVCTAFFVILLYVCSMYSTVQSDPSENS